LQKENGPVTWSPEAEAAFLKISEAIVSGGLMLARYDLPFYIYSDFSYEGMGAILTQQIDGKEYPIMFASRTLLSAEKNYSPTEGEAAATLFALDRFRHII
jgi:RNase H-like domain found in reverse transcriptase